MKGCLPRGPLGMCESVLVLLAAMTICGCGGGDNGELSGVVKFKDQPLPSGRITFHSEAGDKPTKSGEIKDGHYSVSGLPVGPCKVSVETFQRRAVDPKMMPKDLGIKPPEDTDPTKAGKFVPIPLRYADPSTSELDFDVNGGPQPKDFNLKP